MSLSDKFALIVDMTNNELRQWHVESNALAIKGGQGIPELALLQKKAQVSGTSPDL